MTQTATTPRIPTRRASRCLLACLAGCALAGCATLAPQGQPLVPTRYQLRTGPFTLYTNTPVTADAPAARALRDLEREVEAKLGLRVGEGVDPVEIYVLQDKEAFTHFLTFYYPDLPPRRAFFLAQGAKRVVYTYVNDRVEEDLRHEATHALLHAAVGDLPLWLDEGLAEYFEGPAGRQGQNPEHLARLPDDLRKGWRPDLTRLDTLRSIKDMTPRDYRESWAWVHLLLDPADPTGKAALLAYLDDVRADNPATPLSERLAGEGTADGPKLLAHLEAVRRAPAGTRLSAEPAAPRPKVLLQSASPEPPPRRSLAARFFGLFGLGDRRP